MPVLERLAQNFGAAGFVGTQIEVRKSLYTGQIIPPVITGNDKNRCTQEYFSSRSMDVDWDASYAYADWHTDLPLMGLVGHPVAVYPDEALLAHARQRGWPVIGGGNS